VQRYGWEGVGCWKGRTMEGCGGGEGWSGMVSWSYFFRIGVTHDAWGGYASNVGL
jgi:hypothetical protein